MARLVVITHEFDAFAFRRLDEPDGPVRSPYLLFNVLRHLQQLGHDWRVAAGTEPRSGDVALLHVDSTIVGEDYLSLASHYAGTINFGTFDISKRKVSRLLLSRGDDWNGEVIVKTNLNSGANMEDNHNQFAIKHGRPLPHPGIAKAPPYAVLGGLDEVAGDVWDDPGLVVEKFIPEPDPDGGFALRTWVFMGPHERCTRMVTSDRISKAGNVVRYEPIKVPAELRRERERLGFDFGKFDFVMHEGQPVLLDANRTPGIAMALRDLMISGAPKLAAGLDALIRERMGSPVRAAGRCR